MLEQKEENISIYIVDEDELFLKIMRNKFTTSTNYRVKTFNSASEFLLEILKIHVPKNEYVIIILNNDLETIFANEVKDGIEILKSIKKSNPDIDVIMLSSIDNVDAAATAMRVGAVNFLPKNENAFMRIHNNIKFLISEKRLVVKKHQWIVAARWFFILTIVAFCVAFLLLFLKL